MKDKSLVLASGSPFRHAMLAAAGINISVVVPNIDESSHKRDLEQRTPKPSPGDVALHLATLKAENISEKQYDAFVIGSDQVLTFEGEIFSKPTSVDDARRQLRRLRGRTHELVTAVALARNGARVWSHIATARLTMRPFSDTFLEAYLNRQGARLLSTVGAYEIEGLGSQLFESIDGDHFTIVGLPLLPLMAELRRRNALSD